MALDHAYQARRHPLAERGDDLYETPPVADGCEASQIHPISWPGNSSHTRSISALTSCCCCGSHSSNPSAAATFSKVAASRVCICSVSVCLECIARTGKAVGQAPQSCFAWFVWDTAHRGPPELHRISWNASQTIRALLQLRDDVARRHRGGDEKPV
jgi:hypothetical protein